MQSNRPFCCLCSYACVCLLPSVYLKYLLPSIYLIGAYPSYNPSQFRIPQSTSFSVILWFQAPVTWDSGCVRVCGSQAFSEILKSWCDQPPVILWSCYPKTLGMLQCLEVVSPLRTVEMSDQWSKDHVERPLGDWGGVWWLMPKGTWGWHLPEGTCAPGQAGVLLPCCWLSPAWLDWNRCCVPLTSDTEMA